jgi:hypothetical protein
MVLFMMMTQRTSTQYDAERTEMLAAHRDEVERLRRRTAELEESLMTEKQAKWFVCVCCW